jgi:hypothetical protein
VTAGLFSGDVGLGVVIVIAIVFVIAMIIGSRAFRRDPNLRRTRIGWFVERDRFNDDDIDEGHEHVALPSSVTDDTLELPPDKQG